ncbi:MAG: rhodanese-like domain-containing protein [Thiohalomonadales bacterium]
MLYLFRFLSFCFVLLLPLQMASAVEGFPGREKYPDVPHVELGKLFDIRHSVVIVDARSKFEFDTLRIKKAINIPVANASFQADIRQLANSTTKTLVFYCNGHTCMKSYIAAKKAIDIGITNVLAYDAGIFDWTKAFPKHAVLLGQSPVELDKLIAKKHFKSRLLDPDSFSESILKYRRQSLIIDIRDKFQRAGVGFYPGIERWAALDDKKKLNDYIKKAVRENKTLYIYDEVGKQVRWLQYALEKAGVRNYYFMDRGARAYYEMLAKLEWQ